jgi:adenylate cyclase
MTNSLRIEVYRSQDRLYTGTFDRPVVLGRQVDAGEALLELHEYGQTPRLRLAIVRMLEDHVSREQAELWPSPDGVAIKNRSSRQTMVVNKDEKLPAGEERVYPVPCQFRFGRNLSYGVSVWSVEEPVLLTRSTQAPVPGTLAPATAAEWPALVPEGMDSKELDRCRLSLMSVLAQVGNSERFFESAAQAVVDFGMHSGQVLLDRGDDWTTRSRRLQSNVSNNLQWKPSLRVLHEMRKQRSTVWTKDPTSDASQFGLSAIVAAPIFDGNQTVIGALYGDRRGDLASGGKLHITENEVKFIELLGYVIGLCIDRAAHEKAAAEQRVKFEQFFSKRLAEQMAVQPDLLSAHEAKVTVLFCDIRNFSGRAKQLGAEMTLRWIQDVLGTFSQCVFDQEGVVVDYTGDELMAMWGAPAAQPDQAHLACLAAQAMQRKLPEINERWVTKLNEQMQVGIGINSGVAQVGNIGSELKFKYGPLGHTVNLASRVQGVNKFLKTTALITQATRDKLPPEASVRRICSVCVVNIREPVDLYELRTDQDERCRRLVELYERALAHFEAQEFHEAISVLGDYIPEHREDWPSHVLLGRAVDSLVNPKRKFSKVWKLPGK